MSGIDKEIGRRLRAMRRARRMTVAHVAVRTGIRTHEVQRYETGAARISARRLFELAQLFDVPISEFFGGMELAPAPAVPVGEALDGRCPELAQRFSELSEPQKRAVLSLVKSLSFMHTSWDEPKPSRRRDGS